MKAFRVNWQLSQPVSLSDRPLHLDALLAWVRAREAVYAGRTAKQVLSMHEDLPSGLLGKPVAAKKKQARSYSSSVPHLSSSR